MVALLWWWRGGMVVITSKREEERRFLFFSGNRHKLFFSLVFSFHSFFVMLFLLSFSSFFHSLLSSPSSFSSSSFFVVPVTYWWWGVYIGARGACATLPLSNNAERVGWLGGQCAVARKASPLCPFHHNGRPWEGYGLCRGFRHERERRCKEGRENLLTLLQRTLRGKRWQTVPSKWHCFVVLSFFL